jgi:hypothetical protein
MNYRTEPGNSCVKFYSSLLRWGRREQTQPAQGHAPGCTPVCDLGHWHFPQTPVDHFTGPSLSMGRAGHPRGYVLQAYTDALRGPSTASALGFPADTADEVALGTL